MKILLAGFSATTKATIRRIARSEFRDAALSCLPRLTCKSVTPQSADALQCTLCIVDVLGLGWSQWYPEHEARAEMFLAGRAAVLLLPPDASGGWYDSPSFRNLAHRFFIRRPTTDTGIADAVRCAGSAAAQADARADNAYLCSNIWMQQPPMLAPMPKCSLQSVGLRTRKRIASLKKDVFQSAVSALFS